MPHSVVIVLMVSGVIAEIILAVRVADARQHGDIAANRRILCAVVGILAAIIVLANLPQR